MTCEKHRKTPARGYSPCAGCEVEMLQAENKLFRQALDDLGVTPAEAKAGTERSIKKTATLRRLTEMVGAAYTAGWMAGYQTGGILDDESEIDLDWSCGEDWVEDGLRPELLKIIEGMSDDGRKYL